MKTLVMLNIFLLLLSAVGVSQAIETGDMYQTNKSLFSSKVKSKKDQYLIVSKINDSIHFKTKENISIGSIPYSDTFLPDSVSKETNTTIKKIFIYEGKEYISSITANNKNGITENISISIDNKKVLNLESKKGFHCTNHGNIVHTCPTSPGIANPPCNKGCIWVAD